MNRQVVRDLVEDYWRAAMPAMQMGDLEAASAISARFEARLAEVAQSLPPIEAAAFSQAVEAEREMIIQEYQVDPRGLKRRLGLQQGVDAPVVNAGQQRSAAGLGGLAVRTAVRATVWESVIALFRSLR